LPDESAFQMLQTPLPSFPKSILKKFVKIVDSINCFLMDSKQQGLESFSVRDFRV